jgi:hypothetical protein
MLNLQCSSEKNQEKKASIKLRPDKLKKQGRLLEKATSRTDRHVLANIFLS